jgi:UDP-N-acetylmuramoyl-L-alanyl-D-glutamate--2,6-diaminopimelate ligase
VSAQSPPAAPPWAEQLFTVGVTGTNGKTSTTGAVAALLGELARPVARVTTLGSFLDETPIDVAPHYDGFLETMRRGLDAGGRYAALELTSEALALGFARAWPCQIGVFTNLSHDHSDAHGSPEHYLASKAQLFMALRPGGVAVLNASDPNAELLREVTPPGVEIICYSVPSRGQPWAKADLAAHSIRIGLQGTSFELESSQRFPGLPRRWSIPALGEVFVENALAALGAALAASVPAPRALSVLASTPPPRGRFQVLSERPYVVVDYAHTPDALARTVATARTLCAGKLTLVFGAGGHRDRAKRPLLGAAASTADRLVLTSDNPRDEDPSEIIAQIAEGVGVHPHVTHELDRRQAIALAIHDAAAEDWVLILGKGHEQYQETLGVRTTFSDEAIVRELGRRKARAPREPM